MQTIRAIVVTALLSSSAIIGSAQAEEPRWLLRAGIAQVSPNDSSGDVAGFPGNGVSVNNATGLGISISYLLTPNLAVELLGALPFKHEVKAEGPDLGGLGQIVDTRQLPPTLLLNYSLPLTGSFRPYLGVGLNHTLFFKEHASDSLEAALGPSKVNLDASTSYAVQAGFDWALNDNEFFNLALWYIDIATTATIDFAGGPATNGESGRTSVDVDIDPLVVMLGFGRRF